MRSFHRLAGQGSIQLALAFVAVGSWLSGCGDDEKSGGGGGKGGTSGTAGAAGAAGSMTAGSGGATAGSAGNAGSGNGGSGGSGGSAGAPVSGSGGLAGSAGSAGSGGMGGVADGGEGGMGEGGMAGTAGTAGMGGAGGEGGSTEAMCATNDLSFMELNSMQAHDHLPVQGMDRQTLLGMINTGMPLVFTMPDDGTNTHTHTITFTAAQLTTLRNGGTIAMITTSMGGPAMNMHTHTYSIECAP